MQWETIRKIFALAIAFGIGYMAMSAIQHGVPFWIVIGLMIVIGVYLRLAHPTSGRRCEFRCAA
jgi:hypothetical protein